MIGPAKYTERRMLELALILYANQEREGDKEMLSSVYCLLKELT